MPIRAGDRERPGLGAAAKAVSDRLTSIVRLEIDLALAELKRKIAALGVGIGLLAGAAIFGVLMLGFLFATIAVALSLVLDLWAALLVTTGILMLLSGILAFLGITAVSKATPPVPEQAIAEAKLTTEALKNGG